MEKDKINRGLVVRAFCGLSDVYNLVGRYKDGLQSYSKAEMIICDKRSKIDALIGQATIFENLAEYDSVLYVLDRLKRVSHNTPAEVHVLSKYSCVYRLLGRMGESFTAGKRGMELLKSLKKRGFSQIELYRAEAAIVNAMGTFYLSQGDFDEAIILYQRFLKVSEESGNLFGIGMAANNLGSVYTHRGDYDKTIPLFNKKLAISEKLGNKVGIAMAANNLGWIYCEKKRFDKAIELYERALSIAEELGEKLGILNVTINLGSLYKNKVNYDRAFALYRKAMTIAEKIGDKLRMGKLFCKYGEFQIKAGDFEKAKEYNERSFEVNNEIGYKEMIADTCKNIGDYYLKIGDVEKASENYSKALSLYKKLSNGQKTGELSDLIANLDRIK